MYEVLKPLTTHDGAHVPGDVIEADHFHNVRALVEQRYLRPVGEASRLDQLQAHVDALRERVDALEASREHGRRK